MAACGGFAFTTATAQTLVPSTAEQFEGTIRVVFDTTPGMLYRIEHTNDLQSWTLYPDSIYGLGQTANYHVYDLPAPVQSAPPPPASGPQPSENLLFLVTAYDDGSAVASWNGLDGSPQKAYLPSFDLDYQGSLMQEMISGTRVPTSPDLPYYLNVWSWGGGVKNPAVVGIVTAPTEIATLAKLTSQYQWVYDTMQARIDWRAANPGPPPSPPKLFDDRGQPLNQHFRVRAYTTDSNFDGIPDHLQFDAGNGDPFDNDIDGDGIPNGYDRDLWPAAQFPATNALLSNVLINEALLTNDFTNCDKNLDCGDWIELYNPTGAAVDLTGWHLSDRFGNNSRAKWTFPPGIVIASGEFLVVWADGKDRGGLAGEDVNGNGVLDPGENYIVNQILDAPTPIHTNFNLSASTPEAVVLSRPAQNGGTAIIVDWYRIGFTANYGAQRTDVSFGRYPSATGLQTGYMILPTPGAEGAAGLGPVGEHNVVGALGFTDLPTFATASDPPGLYEGTTVTAEIDPPASGGALHFTTNSATPTRYSELYSGPITADRTKLVRAIAAKEGYIPSASITRSYLFKEDIFGTSPQGTTPTDHQGARDGNNQFTGLLFGYPEQTENAPYPILYHMDSSIIAARKDTMRDELDSAPVISIVSTVSEFFELATGGVYPNSGQTENNDAGDPRGRDWERYCSFEIIEPGSTNFLQANAAISITGGSSIRQNTTRKHNLRVKFKNTYGPDRLEYPLFPDSTTTRYFNFNLKNTTHDSWSSTWGQQINQPPSSFNTNATYCNEAFIMDTHRAMGHEVPNQRWSHLFINGIYWGPYLIIERVDDAFMDAHYGIGTYTVVKQASEAVDGDYAEWQSLRNLAISFTSASAAQKPGIYAQITAQVDMANYVDYLLAYLYAQASDWPSNNHRMGRRRNTPGAQWKFIVWDAESSLRHGEQSQSPVNKISSGLGPAIIHARLKDYQPYRDFFSARVNRAFTVLPGDAGSGTLILATAKARFQAAMGRFDNVIHNESGRWGYMPRTAPFSAAPPYIKSDWDTATSYILDNWIHNRQTPFLNALQSANLYVPNP